MTDHAFAAHAAAFAAWQAGQCPDLAQAEARIDALIATLWETTRMLGDQDGEIVYLRALVAAQHERLAVQADRLAALNATIETMAARGRLASLVAALAPLYHGELTATKGEDR